MKLPGLSFLGEAAHAFEGAMGNAVKEVTRLAHVNEEPSLRGRDGSTQWTSFSDMDSVDTGWRN